jgi:hypothetical protein
VLLTDLSSVLGIAGAAVDAALLSWSDVRELYRIEWLRAAGGQESAYKAAWHADGVPAGLVPVYTGQPGGPERGAAQCLTGKGVFIGSTGRGRNALAACSPGVASRLVRAAAAQAAGSGAEFVCVPALSDEDLGALRGCFPPDHYLTSNPMAVIQLDAGDFGDYTRALGGKHGHKARRERRRFLDTGVTVVDLPAKEAVPLAPLLANVERKYGSTDSEDVYKAYLWSAARWLGNAAVAIVAFDGSRPVAFSIVVDCGDRRKVRCYGADYGHHAVRSAYALFNIGIYEPVIRTLAAGQTVLELGAGSLDSKTRRGARTVACTSVSWPVR